MAISNLNLTKLSMDDTTPINTFAKQLSAYGDSINKQKELEEAKAWNDKVRARQEQAWQQEDQTSAANAIANKILAGENELSGAFGDITQMSGWRGYEEGMTPEQEAEIEALHTKLGNELVSNPLYKETELDKINRAVEAVQKAGYNIPKNLTDELRSARAAYLKQQELDLKNRSTKIAGLDKEESDLQLKLGKVLDQYNKNRTSSGGKPIGGWINKMPDLSFTSWDKDNEKYRKNILAIQMAGGYSDAQIAAALDGTKYAVNNALVGANEEGFYKAFQENLANMTPASGRSSTGSNEAAAIRNALSRIQSQRARLNQDSLGKEELIRKSVGDLFGAAGNSDNIATVNTTVNKSNNKNISSLPPVKGSYRDMVMKTETANNNYKEHKKNSKGETETLGAYQFVPSTLNALKQKTGDVFTEEEFLNNPGLQDKYFNLLTEQNTNQLKQNGIEPTNFNLWLMHNLGGGGQTKNFLSNEPLNEKTKKAIKLNLPKGVEPTRENYIEMYGKRFGHSENTVAKKVNEITAYDAEMEKKNDNYIKSLGDSANSAFNKKGTIQINNLEQLNEVLETGANKARGLIDDLDSWVKEKSYSGDRDLKNAILDKLVPTTNRLIKGKDIVNEEDYAIQKLRNKATVNKLKEGKELTTQEKRWVESLLKTTNGRRILKELGIRL